MGDSMEITDCLFKNDDAEYNRIKDLLLEIEICPDVDNNFGFRTGCSGNIESGL